MPHPLPARPAPSDSDDDPHSSAPKQTAASPLTQAQYQYAVVPSDAVLLRA
jgi:hypothetical protein